MVTAKIRRPVQRTDKRGQVPGEPGGFMLLLAPISNPLIIGHDQSLSPRSERCR